ncbi:GPHN [Mytilus coruscus]|uniref:molybdopterin molybdotransferase n=1 Tax=Mytilus coruscus TaxID=42192 RepID=A0A6J8CFR2_MYTCO|nr:GPHN [Mytilus coruscus]
MIFHCNIVMKKYSYLILVSDSCSENRAEDRSGTNLCRLIREENLINGSVAVREIVSDDADKIKNKLMDWSDVKKLNLILTTGGTGFSQRDVTPEATKAILEKEAIGITIAMITQSLQVTKLAMLSRLVCGSRGQSLIINLPGSVKGSEECFRFALPGITHAVDLLKDNSSQIQQTHTHLQSKGVHQDTKQLKEKRHLDIASSVLQKYSKQFPKPRKKKSKHQRKFIGVMVRHSLKGNERFSSNFDDYNSSTVEQTNTEEEQGINSQMYEAVKISSPPKMNIEKENSLDFTNTESLDLPEIENIPSVEEAEIQLIQKMYCDQVNKQSGFSDSSVKFC